MLALAWKPCTVTRQLKEGRRVTLKWNPLWALVVENSKDLREMIQAALLQQGFSHVHAFERLREGEWMLEGRLVEAAIIDAAQLPPGEAAAIHGKYPWVRLLFISGAAGEQLGQTGVFLSSVTFLSKPFTPEELLKAVEELQRGLP